MTISEKVVLREDVAGPAGRAAAGVERLSKTLAGLGHVKVDNGASAKIERAAQAANKAEGRAKDAADRAATLRQQATEAEQKAIETTERLAKLKAAGARTSKAERIAARASAAAARRRAIAERADLLAERRRSIAIKQRGAVERVEVKAREAAESAASKQRIRADNAERVARRAADKVETRERKAAQRAEERAKKASEKREAKARKDAAREEARQKKGLTPKATGRESNLLNSIRLFNPAQERREALLEAQLRQMRTHARAGIDHGGGGIDIPADSGAGGGRAAAIAALAAVATSIASVGARAAIDLGRAAVSAQAFRENAIRALATLRSADGDAKKVFRNAVATADYIGQGRETTVGQYVDLLGQGFDPKLVDRIIRSIADLGTVNPSANVDSIVRAIGKIKATGYLQGDELNMLTEAGLAAGKVYQKLAEKLNKTQDEIKRMQSAGKLDAATTIDAILSAVNDQVGGKPAGLAARKKSIEDIAGLAGRLEAMPSNLLMDLEVSPGMQAFRSFLFETVESLDPTGPRWQRIKNVLGKVLNSIFGTAFEGRDPGALIDRILSKVELAEPLVSKALSGFKTGFEGTIGIFDKLDKAMDGPLADLAKMLGIEKVPWIELVAKGVGFIAGAFGVVIATIGIASAMWVGFFGKIQAMVLGAYGIVVTFAEMIYDAFATESFFGDGESIGDSITAGVVSGLKNGALAVVAAVRALAANTISSASSAFGVASPAKPFIAIGGHVAEGAEVGIENRAGRVIRAAESMAMLATRAANDNVLSPRAAGVASGPMMGGAIREPRGATRDHRNGPTTVLEFGPGSVHIVVQGSATEQDGQAVAKGLWAELRRLSEEAA